MNFMFEIYIRFGQYVKISNFLKASCKINTKLRTFYSTYIFFV